MASLDVNDAFDASFLDEITVIRLVEQVTDHGRVALVPTQLVGAAVVVPSSPDDLQRLPDEEHMRKTITIYSQFRLQGPSEETGGRTHPDEVLWHGTRFVVTALDDYSGFSRGFTVAIATSIIAVDAPPLPDPTGGAFPATLGSA